MDRIIPFSRGSPTEKSSQKVGSLRVNIRTSLRSFTIERYSRTYGAFAKEEDREWAPLFSLQVNNNACSRIGISHSVLNDTTELETFLNEVSLIFVKGVMKGLSHSDLQILILSFGCENDPRELRQAIEKRIMSIKALHDIRKELDQFFIRYRPH